MATSTSKKIAGCLFGMAFGDALGADTEFFTVEEILRQFPPRGPLAPSGNPAQVTDDTQMAVAVGEALMQSSHPYTPTALGKALSDAFISWYNAPDNNRAPGNTCLTACENLIEGMYWKDASQTSSKGCGANMRVMPVGLLAEDAGIRAKIAQFQAAITHGHPTGLAAADLTAFVVADLLNGGQPEQLPQRVRQYAESQRTIYHVDWLEDLWYRVPIMASGEMYIAYGWDECLKVLDRLDIALLKINRDSDPCLATGAGWERKKPLQRRCIVS